MDLWSLSDLCTPWCIHVVATLHIADHLASGTTAIDALASASGAHPESLHRVLRHLVSKGLFLEPTPGQFALNDAAQGLLAPPMRIWLDLHGFGGRMAHAWGTLLAAVQTGKPAYHQAFGQPFWDDLEAHPDIAANFDAGMGPAGHGIPDPNVLLDPEEWPAISTVVDVGGGTGALLAEVLRQHPHLRGTLVDLPRTVANSHELFQAACVADRVTPAGQSFFDPLPAGHDLYLLKSVLGDWPDPEARAILQRCAEAARPSGRIMILSGVVPDDENVPPELLMMVLIGGKNRSLSEFRDLAHKSDLEVRKAGHLPSGRYAVDCRPTKP